MPTAAVLIVTFIAVIFGLFIVLCTVLGIRDRRAPDTPNFDRNRPGQQVRVAYQPDNPRSFTVGPPRRALVAPC